MTNPTDSLAKSDTTIDPESQQFIEWAFGKLADESWYHQTIAEAGSHFNEFYALPPETILPRLRQKMEKGAREHGAPNHPVEAVRREIDNECIDLLGWLLVEKWNTLHKPISEKK